MLGPGRLNCDRLVGLTEKQSTQGLLFWGLDDENSRVMGSENVTPVVMETSIYRVALLQVGQASASEMFNTSYRGIPLSFLHFLDKQYVDS